MPSCPVGGRVDGWVAVSMGGWLDRMKIMQSASVEDEVEVEVEAELGNIKAKFGISEIIT